MMLGSRICRNLALEAQDQVFLIKIQIKVAKITTNHNKTLLLKLMRIRLDLMALIKLTKLSNN